MNRHVVVVGPEAVRGAGPADPELVRTALAHIDDRLVVYRDEVKAVRALWAELLADVEGNDVVVVLPSWWSGTRVALVESVLAAPGRTVGVVRRIDACRHGAVVELGAEFAVVHRGVQPCVAVPRGSAAVARIAAALNEATRVTIDVPEGIAAAPELASELVRRLRHRGVDVVRADDTAVAAAARDLPDVPAQPRRSWRPAAPLVLAAAAVCALGTAAALQSGPEPRPATRWVVEGLVTVEVPAEWAVERVTEGPGSARVQVVSPDEPRVVIHLTYARVPGHESLGQTAEVLRTAIGAESEGRFVDFDAELSRAGRTGVGYRERRRDSTVDWMVVLDGGVRIAVGCERAQRADGWPQACEHAVATARRVS